MAVTAHLYDKFIINGFGGTTAGEAQSTMDLLSNTINCSLHSAYTPDRAAHDFFNDVDGTQCPATGNYASGGNTQAAKTWAAAGDVCTFDNTVDPTWATSTISATQAVVYNATPGANTTDPLIGYVDFGGTVASSAGSFTITWSASGIFTVTLS